MFTKRFISCIVFASLLLVSSSALAGLDCNCIKDSKISGSFIGLRGSTQADAVMDQYILNEDGTVYWNQSSALVLPQIDGTFLAEIGTWSLKGDHIILTTVSAASAPVAGDDLNINNYTRSTQEFKIINKNTLQVIHRVFRTFNLNENPLTDQGTIVLDSFSEFTLNKVKIRPSDL